MTKLTVCMPVYNGEKYLPESVGSILGQTYKDFVLRIYDDGSTDDSVAVIESFNDPRIEIIRGGENKGSAVARAELINSIDTEYCMWLDSDDVFCKENAFRIATDLAAHDGYDLINFIKIKEIYQDGRESVRMPYRYGNFLYFGDKFFETYFPVENQFIFNSKLIRTDLFRGSIPDKEILHGRLPADDIFFIPMCFWNAKGYLHATNFSPIYAYRRLVGYWDSKAFDKSAERTRSLCDCQKKAFLSLYERMSADREMTPKEVQALANGTLFTIIARRMSWIIRTSDTDRKDEMLSIWHEFFCADGAHLINGVDNFEMPMFVAYLEGIIK